MSSDSKYLATVLIGPTASGKTPLGDLIAARGLPDGSYVHFDFGHQLREIQRGRGAAAVLSASDCQLVEEVLGTGRLLTPQETPLAMAVLRWFLDSLRTSGNIVRRLVLNGLPRTPYQARAMESFVHVQRGVVLESSREVAWLRIQSNIGGDRAARADDTYELLGFKFEQYLAETRPLIEYFRNRQVPILELKVVADTRPEELWKLLWDAVASGLELASRRPGTTV